MVNIVGFSRGGTHLFWCFISSHPELKNAKLEVNDLVGLKKLRFWAKLKLEVFCLFGVYSSQFDWIDENVVYKAVCSWYPNSIFKLLQRHNPMKYIENTRFRGRKTVFLVKRRKAQKNSWMRRDAPKRIASKAYDEHLAKWHQFSKRHPCLFVEYDEFCKEPEAVTYRVWEWLGLSAEPLAKEIEVKPKAHKSDPNGLPANDPGRRWEFVPTQDLILSLNNDND